MAFLLATRLPLPPLPSATRAPRETAALLARSVASHTRSSPYQTAETERLAEVSRRRQFQLSLAVQTGMSCLELTWVTEATMKDHRRRLESLRVWCRLRGRVWRDPADLDSLLV